MRAGFRSIRCLKAGRVMASKIRMVVYGLVFAVASATAAVMAASQSAGIGLKDINYAREPLTSILRHEGAAGQDGTRPMTPQQAKEQLEARGFHDISLPRRRGRVAVVAATAQRGERLTLVIDLFSGEITGARLQAVPDPKDIKKR